MDKELLKGSIDILILLLILNSDKYGYEIAKIIKINTNNMYQMQEGTLYPALKRLEQKKLIESYWQNSPNKIKRKYYKITENGRIELAFKLKCWDRIDNLIKTFINEREGI
ncbi:MAG: PadR family transcriptional regulator [Clostridium sp.]|uniref:PadR family transcriptional regulator n=1 Tax=Clostridium sp. TaxID=1506 RepID=UPI0025BF0168|nr:PadR family transcriptional regulator [Clostridium sp.]MCH3963265.1 PadR family transcriptional regulator [Clostridium sp.]MCI1717350.1 PadR family transcriptional regulator [Clostridium sp.]MCI1801690.1 PadR family transcriptional regulator [Clostridium sp.]MCI1815536.1 PadR family transcriptional regulator [Clostridium sp.]MCI1872439.1 PadR family transcriptional regulator [Clostridium sp.]